MTDITAVLNELSTLVTAIQSKNLTQELALEGTVSLEQRKSQITNIINRIQRAQPSDFDRLYIDAVQVVTSVKRDLSDLSTQELGYRLSILDLANMLGEPVFVRRYGVWQKSNRLLLKVFFPKRMFCSALLIFRVRN